MQGMARYINLWAFLNQHQSKADIHPNNFENCGSENFEMLNIKTVVSSTPISAQ
jgi:hypothetical protein